MRRRRIARTRERQRLRRLRRGRVVLLGVGRHRQPPRRVLGGGGGRDPGPRMGRGRGPRRRPVGWFRRSWRRRNARGRRGCCRSRPRRCPGARASRAGGGTRRGRTRDRARRCAGSGAGARATAAPARPPWDGFGSAPPRRRGCRRRGTPGWPRASRPKSRRDVRGEKVGAPQPKGGGGAARSGAEARAGEGYRRNLQSRVGARNAKP